MNFSKSTGGQFRPRKSPFLPPDPNPLPGRSRPIRLPYAHETSHLRGQLTPMGALREGRTSTLVRQDSTQFLLDRAHHRKKMAVQREQELLAAAAAKPQEISRRNTRMVFGPAGSISPSAMQALPTLKDMVISAFTGLGKSCPKGIQFPRIVAFIRSHYPLSAGMNQALESQVGQCLRSLALKGVVVKSNALRPQDGSYRLMQTPNGGPGVEFVITGFSLPVAEARVAEPKVGQGLLGPSPSRSTSAGSQQESQDIPKRQYRGKLFHEIKPPRLDAPNAANNPMLTKSFGARAGNALKKDVSQRPNTPHVQFAPKKHISYGVLADPNGDLPINSLPMASSTQGFLGSPHRLRSPNSVPSASNPWRLALAKGIPVTPLILKSPEHQGEAKSKKTQNAISVPHSSASDDKLQTRRSKPKAWCP